MNGLSYRWRLWKLQRWWDSTSRRYDRKHREATAAGAKREELEDIRWAGKTELEALEDEIVSLETRYLLGQAQRLLLATPEIRLREKGGVWAEWKTNPGKVYLAPEGIAQLRAAVRREKREQREAVLIWLAAATGIIGALTGLVSVIMN